MLGALGKHAAEAYKRVNCSKMSKLATASITTRALNELEATDRRNVIHPYAKINTPSKSVFVESANGCYLNLSDGRKVVDGMSSWWAAVHGYNHPKLNEAIAQQLNSMSHVMFGGLSHQPAAELTERLVALAPKNLDKVFFCDSGSIAVEVALKMAIQKCFSETGSSKKSKFISLKNAYHGDTFGAMAVCDPENGMHSRFAAVLPKHYFVDSPSSSSSTPDIEKEQQSLMQVKDLLETKGDEIAAVIIEPIVQGAGGMKFHSFDFLRSLKKLTTDHKTILIFDEIATGFGRTGNMFACMDEENAETVEPDIMCVGKALSGGYMTFAATLVSPEVYDHIKDPFMHGPTFMGNPLACAVSNASIQLLMDSPWKERVTRCSTILKDELEIGAVFQNPAVANVRIKGAIGVVELRKSLAKYMDVQGAQEILLQNGVWLRPFGKILYTMPTFNAHMEDSDLTQIGRSIKGLLEALKTV